MKEQLLYQVALTMINGVGDILARHLLESFGNAEAIFKESQRLLEKVPGIGPKLINEIRRPEVLLRAEKEIDFIRKNQITPYFLSDIGYPARLRECPDAPVMLYYKGNADLNATRVISIVGTRRSSHYGRDLTEGLIKDLSIAFPDLLIVSGLAYGIDIQAHRSALKHKLPTVGVLAHGLDRIYPPTHVGVAREMLAQGGLLTDFPSDTQPDKPNFVKRNRIVAGLSEATVVIESAGKGGSLITAGIAFSYGRDVLSFPGRTTDVHSQGCNHLIRQNKAALITSAEDLVTALCWDKSSSTKPVMEARIPFAEDSPQEKILYSLQKEGELHINQLALAIDIPVYQLSSLLFELEMENLIRVMPGGVYRRNN